ncbi:hypothetical protein GQS65_11060 [Halomarina oriensis]|uniref:Uncharacterized protein n=1 Tax=Halomarina oriensis TaxID=671145 RepID=A0A6B0GTG5_9EURY|nr:hypothetical protein [Halomarina oriensis]
MSRTRHRRTEGLRALATSGLLQQNENDLYDLSNIGREFLVDDLDTDEVEALDPSADS